MNRLILLASRDAARLRDYTARRALVPAARRLSVVLRIAVLAARTSIDRYSLPCAFSIQRQFKRPKSSRARGRTLEATTRGASFASFVYVMLFYLYRN